MRTCRRPITIFQTAALLLSLAAIGSAQADKTKFPAAIIVLHARGFYPAAITQHPGRILFIVHNASGVSQVSMHLVDSGGKNVHDLPAPNHSRSITIKSDWQELVTLTPGQYSLVEDAHSNWVCQINIK